MKKFFKFFFEENTRETSLVGMVFLFFSQLWLLILVPYLSPLAASDHILGSVGFFIADQLVRTMLGASAFAIPFACLWLGLHFILRRENLSFTIQQIVAFSLFLFCTNIFLLSTAMIATPWAGLFPLFFYSLVVHLFSDANVGEVVFGWKAMVLMSGATMASFLFFVLSLRIDSALISKGLQSFMFFLGQIRLGIATLTRLIFENLSKVTSMLKQRASGKQKLNTFGQIIKKKYLFGLGFVSHKKELVRSESDRSKLLKKSWFSSFFLQRVDEDILGEVLKGAETSMLGIEDGRMPLKVLSEEEITHFHRLLQPSFGIDRDVDGDSSFDAIARQAIPDAKSNKNEAKEASAVVDFSNTDLFLNIRENLSPKPADKSFKETSVGKEVNTGNGSALVADDRADEKKDEPLHYPSNTFSVRSRHGANPKHDEAMFPRVLNRDIDLAARRQICSADTTCLRESNGAGSDVWDGDRQGIGIVKKKVSDTAVLEMGEKLVETFAEFGIKILVEGVSSGPVITQYQISLEPGIRIQKVVALADNLALSLAAPSLRIVAPIPGKSLIGIEVPKKNRQTVLLSAMLSSQAVAKRRWREEMSKKTHLEKLRQGEKKELQEHFFPTKLPISFGVSILGEPLSSDLTKTPHLLIAGATGSGKSVCVNAIITSLLLTLSPNELRLLMIDPKMVELNVYNGIPHLLHPVISQAKDASKALNWVIREMERRYRLLETRGVRNITSYNALMQRESPEEPRKNSMPYIVVVIDELADLMMTARREVEDSLCRLAAMSRAVGIHLILATQRPSVDVITGLIKSNFPSRIAFQVSSKIDSRTIIDGGGAEKLLGKGDMLVQSTEHTLVRLQGAFLSEDEVKTVVADLVAKSNGEVELMEDLLDSDEDEEKTVSSGGDTLFDRAVEIALRDQKVSASYLQRRLKIGYNRAARLVEEMEERGYVGAADGSKPREVLINSL